MEKDPALQGEQSDTLPGDAVPGGHVVQVALKKPLAAVPLDAVPGGHAVHADADDAPAELELEPRRAQRAPRAGRPARASVHASAPGHARARHTRKTRARARRTAPPTPRLTRRRKSGQTTPLRFTNTGMFTRSCTQVSCVGGSHPGLRAANAAEKVTSLRSTVQGKGSADVRRAAGALSAQTGPRCRRPRGNAPRRAHAQCGAAQHPRAQRQGENNRDARDGREEQCRCGV